MRPLVLRLSFLLLVLFVPAAFAQPGDGARGFTILGHDYINFPAPFARACHNSCAGHPACKSWTWVRPGPGGQFGHCWLKSIADPELVPNADCTSGQADMRESEVTAEDDTDRIADNFNQLNINGVRECEDRCRREHQCSSWTYQRRTQGMETGICYLKGLVGRPVPRAGFVSGVKFRPRNL